MAQHGKLLPAMWQSNTGMPVKLPNDPLLIQLPAHVFGQPAAEFSPNSWNPANNVRPG